MRRTAGGGAGVPASDGPAAAKGAADGADVEATGGAITAVDKTGAPPSLSRCEADPARQRGQKQNPHLIRTRVPMKLRSYSRRAVAAGKVRHRCG